MISSRENVFILQNALPYLCTILYLFIIVIIIMGISNYDDVENLFGTFWKLPKKNNSPLKCLKIYSHENSTGLL